MGEFTAKDQNGSPAPWLVSGCLVKDAKGAMVAYVQFDRDRREVAASPLVTDALDALIRDVITLAKIVHPEEGIEGLEDRIPGINARYNQAYQAMNVARWRNA